MDIIISLYHHIYQKVPLSFANLQNKVYNLLHDRLEIYTRFYVVYIVLQK